MSDWQVGDLALCVDAHPRRCGCGWVHRGNNVCEGRMYRVVAVGVSHDFEPFGCDKPSLLLDHGLCALASRLRKICPDEHTGCEPEFVELLKRTKVAA